MPPREEIGTQANRYDKPHNIVTYGGKKDSMRRKYDSLLMSCIIFRFQFEESSSFFSLHNSIVIARAAQETELANAAKGYFSVLLVLWKTTTDCVTLG